MGPDVGGAKPPSVCPAPSRTEGTWRFIGRTSSFRGRSDLGLHWRCQVVDLVYLPELFPPPTSHSLTPRPYPPTPPSRPQPTLGPTSLTSPGHLPIHLDRRLPPALLMHASQGYPTVRLFVWHVEHVCLSVLQTSPASCKPLSPLISSAARPPDRILSHRHSIFPSSCIGILAQVGGGGGGDSFPSQLTAYPDLPSKTNTVTSQTVVEPPRPAGWQPAGADSEVPVTHRSLLPPHHCELDLLLS